MNINRCYIGAFLLFFVFRIVLILPNIMHCRRWSLRIISNILNCHRMSLDFICCQITRYVRFRRDGLEIRRDSMTNRRKYAVRCLIGIGWEVAIIWREVVRSWNGSILKFFDWQCSKLMLILESYSFGIVDLLVLRELNYLLPL